MDKKIGFLATIFASFIGQKVHTNFKQNKEFFNERKLNHDFIKVNEKQVFRAMSQGEVINGITKPEFYNQTSASLINVNSKNISTTFKGFGVSISEEEFLEGKNDVYEVLFAGGGSKASIDSEKSQFDECIDKGVLTQEKTVEEFDNLNKFYKKHSSMNELIVGLNRNYYEDACPTIVSNESIAPILPRFFTKIEEKTDFAQNVNNIRMQNGLKPCLRLYYNGQMYELKNSTPKAIDELLTNQRGL